MKAVNKILLVAGAALAAWYVPTLLAIYNLTFDIIAVVPTGANESKISFLVTVRLKNNTGVRINMQHIKADIMLNGLKVAQFNQAETGIILPHAESNFNVAFDIDVETVGTELLKQLLSQNLQNSVLNIRGTLTGNNKSIPFDMYKTLNDIKL